jgi:hypothetical protein
VEPRDAGAVLDVDAHCSCSEDLRDGGAHLVGSRAIPRFDVGCHWERYGSDDAA